MVFPLVKVFERRLEHNMSRHRLDASLVAKRPQPCCKPKIFKEIPQKTEEPLKVAADQELMSRFIDQVAIQEPEIKQGQESVPEVFKPMPSIQEEYKDKMYNKDKDYFHTKNFHRVGSVESNFYTESESDCSYYNSA
ncbi:unnamed protein product [Bursaphelenchus xylophilus]|uniref:(pine wood nematode) hypothetical protein n=1 Tax=Bursaphelenchus xylophilus TaxID=6326 RepID=A0A1I7SF89_BURXY|nr:unnamed protein product [Bursaphelenchus xylophilus]CAG9130465.1 unnamed protein product [Bursaphelenchus xylophilus]